MAVLAFALYLYCMTNLDCYANLSAVAHAALEGYLRSKRDPGYSAVRVNQARAQWEQSETRILKFKAHIRKEDETYADISTFEDC